MTCKHCNEEVISNSVRKSPEPFVYHPYKHDRTHFINCTNDVGDPLGTKAEPGGVRIMEFCKAVAPGRKNQKIFGCIKLEGHSGYHLNGQNVRWRNYAPETPEETPCPTPEK